MNQIDSINHVLQKLNREVWVVTSAAREQYSAVRGGLCATWVSQASIDPGRPIMLIGIAPNHFTAELIERSGLFVLHLLKPSQAELALNFALDSGRDRDKLAGISVVSSPQGIPILDDCLAWLECRVFAKYNAGDRNFYWADVLTGQSMGDFPPLRENQLFGAASLIQKTELLQGRNTDIELHRPWHEAWRSANPFRS